MDRQRCRVCMSLSLFARLSIQPLQATSFLEFLSSREARLILLSTALGMLIAIGVYAVARFRDAIKEDKPSANELLTNFRELHSQGHLSDEEFRTIKTQLGARLREEIKDSDTSG